jgi:ferredoxin
MLGSEQRDSMTVHFKLPEKAIDVPCYRYLNLLAHAQLEELEIGSRCGGHGICGGDRVQVEAPADAVSPPTEAEREHLGEELIAQGWRLACQCYPSADDFSIRVTSPQSS